MGLAPALRATWIVGLCAALLLGQLGCATSPEPLNLFSQADRIGVVSAQYTPAVEFELPAKGVLAGTGRGAVRGTGAMIVLVPSMTLTGTLVGAYVGLTYPSVGPDKMFALVAAPFLGGALGAAMGAITGAGYMVGGLFAGPFYAESKALVEESEKRLQTAVVEMRIQEAMQEAIIEQGRAIGFQRLLAIKDQGPTTPSDLLTYLPLKDAQLDYFIEVRVTRLWLKSASAFPKKPSDIWLSPQTILKINPPLSFGMEVRAKVIRSADAYVLDDTVWRSESDSKLFREWAENDGRVFQEEFAAMNRNFAIKITNNLTRFLSD